MNPGNDDDDAVQRAQFVADDDCLRIDEICTRLHVEPQWIVELVELGALDPRGGREPGAWVFQRRELPLWFGPSPIVPWNFVARTTSSRRPASALPTISSDSPRP